MICLDTMVLIWGVQGVAKPSQVHKIEIASRFVAHLGPKDIVMVPAVALGEYLTGFPDARKRAEQFGIIDGRFFVPAYDPYCATVAAELAQSPEARHLMEHGDRKAVKADIQIIATAIVHGASKIVTGNVKEYEKIARGQIKISDIPEVHVQEVLDLETQSS